MTTRFADHLLDGDHATRPAAPDVPVGTLYACADHSLIYQSDGSAWSTWATLGDPATSGYLSSTGDRQTGPLAVASPAALPLPGSAKTGDPAVGTKVVTLVNDSAYNAFPALAVAPDGRLVCAYRSGVDHATTPANVVSRHSSDFGATWSTAATIVDDPTLDARDPMFTLLSDDRLALQYFLYNGSVGTAVKVAFSTDGGDTYATTVTVPFTFTGDVRCSSRVVEGTDGTLYVAAYGKNTGDANFSSRVMKSTDGGTTWGGEVTIANGVADARNYTEVGLGFNAAGNLMALIRQDGTSTSNTWRTVSTDSAATWSTPADVGDNTGRPSWILTQSGAVVMLCRRRSDSAHVLTTSWDDGLTWTTPSAVGDIPAAGQQSAYAQLVEAAPGLIAVAYATDTASESAKLQFRYLLDGIGFTPLGDQRLATSSGQAGTERLFIGAGQFDAVSGSPNKIGVPGVGYPFSYQLDANSVEQISAVADAAPASWNTFDLVVMWAPTTTGAGGVVFQMFNNWLTEGALPNTNKLDSAAVTGTAPGVSAQVVRTTLLSDVARQEKPLHLRLVRQATNAADTYGADAAIIGVELVRAT